MVARMLGLERPPEPLDASDALALALTFAVRRSSPIVGL
jgi:Holliday junction resolvasome RuvABC endonuclease subunit